MKKDSLLKSTNEFLAKSGVKIKSGKKLGIYGERSYKVVFVFFLFIICICYMIVGPSWLQVIVLDDKDLSDRTSNLSTIIGLSLTVSTLLISNLAKKKREHYELLFSRTYIFPIIYSALGLLIFFIGTTLIKKSTFFPKHFVGNLILAGHYLIIILILSIAILFKNIVKVYNNSYLKDELLKQFKKILLKERDKEVVKFTSKMLYKEKLSGISGNLVFGKEDRYIYLDFKNMKIKDIKMKSLLKIIGREYEETMHIYIDPVGIYDQQFGEKIIMIISCTTQKFERIQKEIKECFVFSDEKISKNAYDNLFSLVFEPIGENLVSSTASSRLDLADLIGYIVEAANIYTDEDAVSKFIQSNNMVPSFLSEGISYVTIETTRNIKKIPEDNIYLVLDGLINCIDKFQYKHLALFFISLKPLVQIYYASCGVPATRQFVNKEISDFFSNTDIRRICMTSVDNESVGEINKYIPIFFNQYLALLYATINKNNNTDWRYAMRKFKMYKDYLDLPNAFYFDSEMKRLVTDGHTKIVEHETLKYNYKKNVSAHHHRIELILQAWLFLLIEEDKIQNVSDWIDLIELQDMETEELINHTIEIITRDRHTDYLDIEDWDYMERENFRTRMSVQSSNWLFTGLIIEMFRRGIESIDTKTITNNSYSLHILEKTKRIFERLESRFDFWADMLYCKDIAEFNAKKNYVSNTFFTIKRNYAMYDLQNKVSVELHAQDIDKLKRESNSELFENSDIYNILLEFNALEILPYDPSMQIIKRRKIETDLKDQMQTDAGIPMWSKVIGMNLGYSFNSYVIEEIVKYKPYEKYNDLISAIDTSISNVSKAGYQPTIIFLSRNLFRDRRTEKFFTYNWPISVKNAIGSYKNIPVLLLDADDILIVADIAASFKSQVGYFDSEDDKIKLEIHSINEDEARDIFSTDSNYWKNSHGEIVSEVEALLIIRNSLILEYYINSIFIIKNAKSFEVAKII